MSKIDDAYKKLREKFDQNEYFMNYQCGSIAAEEDGILDPNEVAFKLEGKTIGFIDGYLDTYEIMLSK